MSAPTIDDRIDSLEREMERLEQQRESLAESILRLARELGHDDLADAFESRSA